MKPFLKWCGSKRALLPKLLKLVPVEINTYREDFLGSGALFFALASEEPRRFKDAILSDANEELINCYREVRDCVEAVIAQLGLQRANGETFHGIARLVPSELTTITRAVRFLYLNRVAFNGLYRVNAKGEFNVPFGRRANGKPIEVCPPEYAATLRACSQALQGVELRAQPIVREYDLHREGIEEGDFSFWDPPYVPVNDDSFTAYTSTGFDLRDHAALVDLYEEATSRGARVLLCNADTPVSRDLYRGLKTVKVKAPRSVSGKAKGRGMAREVLVVGR